MAEIIFGDYKPEEKENPYSDTVRALADFNDESKSVTLVVDVNDAAKEQFKFQRAANEIQKTARLRHTDSNNVKIEGFDEDGNEVKSGTVALIFTLTKMHKGRRTKKSAVENSEEITDADIAEFSNEEVAVA